jgi:cytochrome c oxidase cbb3-type subunit 2
MVAMGGLAEITPLFIQAHSVAPAPGQKPYDALRLAGKDIYVREGCYLCHSQMVRTLRFETQRYGDFSVAADSVYDRPFQWGSKRTGPDLARVGGRYTDARQRQYLLAPARSCGVNMPDYPWLAKATLDGSDIQARMRSAAHARRPVQRSRDCRRGGRSKGQDRADALAYSGLGFAGVAKAVAAP